MSDDSEKWLIRKKSVWDSSIFSSGSGSDDSDCHSEVVDRENDEDAETELSSSLQESSLDQVIFDLPNTEMDLGSPKTPPSSTPRTPLVECPGAPSIRTLRFKEMLRQNSLSETKLLMTTNLKRTYSNFFFDKHFDFLREIGRGSSSKVLEARDIRNGGLCAVKISLQPFFAREDREKFLREIQSVACIPEHPNVVKYYRGWQQDAHFHIQMELCDGGNLRNYLDSLREPLEEPKIWSIIQQLASGLDHIHSHGVLHLDIKPENILLSSEGTLKIGDFGLAVQKQNLYDWEEGDGAYVAPELLRDNEPGPEADMFSFGMMIYEVATGEVPPRPNPEVEPTVVLPSCRTPLLGSLIQALLKLDPSERPTAKQVLKWRDSPKEGS